MATKKPVYVVIMLATLLPAASTALAENNVSAGGEPDMFARTVSDAVLDGQRGKALTPSAVLTAMGLDGTVQENLAQNTVNGRNVIAGAFSNASGLSTAIMNSGNNVLIQNATILLLDVH